MPQPRLFLAALVYLVAATLHAADEFPLHQQAAELRFEHALRPGPSVAAWREAARRSVYEGTPRPEPLPVFRYLVSYEDGRVLPVVVRWTEAVEADRRRPFDPVSRFIAPMAWAEVCHESPADTSDGERDVRYLMRWPNPFPATAIASVRVEPILEAGTPLVHAVTAASEAPPTGRARYVSPTGDDAASGDFEHPWATPHHAASAAGPGDTVYFREGTYAILKPIVPARSGSADAWITYASYPGETALFDGRGLTAPGTANELYVEWNGAPAAVIATRAGVWHLLGCSFVRLRGLAIQDSAFAGICVDAVPWWPVKTIRQPRIPRSHHLELLHNRIQRTSNVGLGVYGGILPGYDPLHDITVVGNLIFRAHDRELFLAGQDRIANQVENRAKLRARKHISWGDENLDFHAVQNLEVAFNEVSHSGKEGVDLMNGTRTARVHHNYIHDLYHTAVSGGRIGIYLDCRSEQWDLEIADNVCERNGVGIQLDSEDGAPAHDIRILRNTCRYNYWSGINVGLWTPTAKPIRRVRVEQNIVHHNGYLPGNPAPGGGIHLFHAIAEKPTPTLREVVVADNLVALNRDYQIAHARMDLKAADIVIARNRVWPADLATFSAKYSERYLPTLGDEPVLSAPPETLAPPTPTPTR